MDLNPKYLYLAINGLAFAIPFVLSFHSRVKFSSKWRAAWAALFFSAIVFTAWDMLFTEIGVWGFNTRYITGVYLYNLPLEEVMFFFCIPYACLFTYFALGRLIEKDHLFPHQELISSLLVIGVLVAGVFFLDRLYTSVTFLLAGFFLAYHTLRIRPAYMGRFYLAFLVLMAPFAIINGALTGLFTAEPVVWYNDTHNTGLRLATIPAEDVVYSLLMMLIPVTIFEKFVSIRRRGTPANL